METPTIIMIARNSEKHIKFAIDSIINNTRHPYKLFIVESESDDGTAEIADSYERKFRHVKVFHTKKEGVIKAFNFGMKKAKGDVYLTHDDVIIPNLHGRDWLDTMVRISKADNCGAIISMGAGGVSGPDYFDGLHWAGTWSTYIPRRTINKIGYFDENFGLGNGEDIDYSYRIYDAGLMIFVANFWVDHHRMTEHVNDKEISNLELNKKRNSKYFKKKYNLK
jgi:glycosyltransferase involved in cell wall biosynthesis